MLKKIDCKAVRQEMLTEAKLELTKIYAMNDHKLKLVVIQVEGDCASDKYIAQKKKTCKEVGVEFESIILPNDVSYECLYNTILNCNKDISVTGIILQLPIPKHLEPYKKILIDAIDWKKDVDGLTSKNVTKLWTTNDYKLTPATPTGILRLLPKDLSGKTVTIIGRSDLVGKPLFKLLMDRNATVTVCHSKSKKVDVLYHSLDSDIIISAVGLAKFIKVDDMGENKIFIDVGINFDENGKMCGDFKIGESDETNINETKYTPVPGGVGVLTTAQLILNLLICYKLQTKKD